MIYCILYSEIDPFGSHLIYAEAENELALDPQLAKRHIRMIEAIMPCEHLKEVESSARYPTTDPDLAWHYDETATEWIARKDKYYQEAFSTILATIVGERPAVVPENIGVFVVEEGAVTAA